MISFSSIGTLQLDETMQLMAQKTGLRIPPEAHARFDAVLRERAAHLGHGSPEAYCAFLSTDEASGEWEEFIRLFTSCETFFFRDHGQFNLLRLRLLPELIARHRHDKTLRLWSAGCASGEEAYSLAMLVDMLLPHQEDWNVFILGTDIDSRAIARARLGRYGKWSFRMVPAAVQQRYFRQTDGEWMLDERIRRMVTFRITNLVSETFPDADTGLYGMDLILCRNLFIYFTPAAISSVAAKFTATLNEGGYLMTAHTELIGYEVEELKSRLFSEGVVYQRHTLPATYAPPLPPPAAKRPVSSLQPRPASRKRAPEMPAPILPQTADSAAALAAAARQHADRGEYELAERKCRESLALEPLAAPPYFLLAQLAQFKGDFDLAREQLNKAIYLDNHCVAAYLELAALHERTGDLPQAHALRRAALGIVRSMPDNAPIELYERTAGEVAQWLAQWEQSANGNGHLAESASHGN